VAPGGHVQAVMDRETVIRESYGIFNEKNLNLHNYFELSGSSQSTAVTSGIVALMLQANPDLTPDDIKCRLIATARVATTGEGNLAFSVFQQGAGLVDAMAAIESTEVGCGNSGLSIANDMSGEEHFIGPARQHENNGDFYIPGVEGLEWSGVYTDSQLWGNSRFSSDSQLWGNSNFSSDSQLWGNSSFNSNSQLWDFTSFSSNSQLWGNSSFQADSQLWGNSNFNINSQLWGNSRFSSDSQLWGNSNFSSNSVETKWVDHE
jgi:serine protease AprX